MPIDLIVRAVQTLLRAIRRIVRKEDEAPQQPPIRVSALYRGHTYVWICRPEQMYELAKSLSAKCKRPDSPLPPPVATEVGVMASRIARERVGQERWEEIMHDMTLRIEAERADAAMHGGICAECREACCSGCRCWCHHVCKR